MFGLEFDLARFVTATYSSFLGAGLALTIAFWRTKEQRKSLRIIASFLGDLDSERFITADEKGRLTGKGVTLQPAVLDLGGLTPEERRRVLANLSGQARKAPE